MTSSRIKLGLGFLAGLRAPAPLVAPSAQKPLREVVGEGAHDRLDVLDYQGLRRSGYQSMLLLLIRPKQAMLLWLSRCRNRRLV